MMAHDTYHMLISLALDGELNETEHVTLNQHLQTCHACSDMWARMSLLDTMFSKQVEVAPPPDFANRVMAHVGNYRVQRRWHPLVIAGLIISSLLSALTIGLPVFMLSWGVEGLVARFPRLGLVIGYLADGLVLAAQGLTFLIGLLSGWLTFLFTDPSALTVVLAALVMASTWIGVLESMKHSQLAAQQQAP